MTVGEDMGGRRERRKAQTRAEVRATAQRLFAERGFDAVTIADVAAAADVAVQTVFNHFETKEALFFDDRTPWVEGIAAAVAGRRPGSSPLTAMRDFLQADLTAQLEQESGPEKRDYLEALARSASLQAGERTLVEQAGDLVARELTAAITADSPGAPMAAVEVLSRLAADLFVIAGRVLVLDHRRHVLAAGPELRRPVHSTTTVTLGMLEHGVRDLAARLGVPVD